MRGSKHKAHRGPRAGGSGHGVGGSRLRVWRRRGFPGPRPGDEVVLQRLLGPGVPVDSADAAAGHWPAQGQG